MVPGEETRSNGHKNETQEVPSKHEPLLYCASDGALEQVLQSCCGISLLGNLKKMPGLGPGQPVLGVAA